MCSGLHPRGSLIVPSETWSTCWMLWMESSSFLFFGRLWSYFLHLQFHSLMDGFDSQLCVPALNQQIKTVCFFLLILKFLSWKSVSGFLCVIYQLHCVSVVLIQAECLNLLLVTRFFDSICLLLFPLLLCFILLLLLMLVVDVLNEIV